eukprot:FR737020.1.p2 GENE.FR737020.1~~FR737020.1.p2  ORF type:complete len:135 (+),score=55.92 FR737020.1:779-1183(+)
MGMGLSGRLAQMLPEIQTFIELCFVEKKKPGGNKIPLKPPTHPKVYRTFCCAQINPCPGFGASKPKFPRKPILLPPKNLKRPFASLEGQKQFPFPGGEPKAKPAWGPFKKNKIPLLVPKKTPPRWETPCPLFYK